MRAVCLLSLHKAFRKSNPHLDISRPEIFHAWKQPLLQQFGSLVTGGQSFQSTTWCSSGCHWHKIFNCKNESLKSSCGILVFVYFHTVAICSLSYACLKLQTYACCPTSGEILDGCEEVPVKLQPLFQLCGLTSALTLPWQRLQALESLRLQLPPGPISAILALCQLQLHYTAFTGNVLENYDISGVSHCASFGRLVISLVTDPDFRRALDSEGSLGSSLALQSIRVQLQRCTPAMPSELGRLRLLQAQASALQARIDDAADPEEDGKWNTSSH